MGNRSFKCHDRKSEIQKKAVIVKKSKAPKLDSFTERYNHDGDDEEYKLNLNKMLFDLEHKQESIAHSPSFEAKKKQKEMSVVLQAAAKQTATVIFLHGLGDTGHGWSYAFKEFKKPHIKYIFPTAPISPVALNGNMPMNSWFNIYGLTPDAPQDEEGIKNSRKIYFSQFKVLDLVQTEIENGIPAERIVIGGFSQGGATALYTALTSDHTFGAVLALSTWLPVHNKFPASLKQTPNKFSTPIFQAHGDSDFMVPIQWAEKSVEGLKAMGFTAVNFKRFSGMGHESYPEEMSEVDDLITKVCP